MKTGDYIILPSFMGILICQHKDPLTKEENQADMREKIETGLTFPTVVVEPHFIDGFKIDSKCYGHQHVMCWPQNGIRRP